MPNVQTTLEKFTVEIRGCTRCYSTNTVNIPLLWGEIPLSQQAVGALGLSSVTRGDKSAGSTQQGRRQTLATASLYSPRVEAASKHSSWLPT